MIEAEAQERIVRYIRFGKKEAKCVLEMAAPKEGYFVGPAIFSDVDPRSRIAQEEIFGPVLSVIKARDFDSRFADRERFSVRTDRWNLFTLAGAYRTSAQRISRRQSLHQPRHHRRGRRAPAFRRAQAFRHRLQSGRPGLSACSFSNRGRFLKTRCAMALRRRRLKERT